MLLRPGDPPTPVARRATIRICDLRDVLDGGGTSSAGPTRRRCRPARSASIPSAAACCWARPADGPLLAPSTTARRATIGGGEYERTPRGRRAGDAARRVGGRRPRCSRDSTPSPRGGRLADRRQPDLRARRRPSRSTASRRRTRRDSRSWSPRATGAAADRRRRRRSTLDDRRARHGWSSTGWCSRRRAAPCRPRPTTSRASWCCATARWCRPRARTRRQRRVARRAQPDRRAPLRQGDARALHHRAAARRRADAEVDARSTASSMPARRTTSPIAGDAAGGRRRASSTVERMHGDRQGARRAAAARLEQHLLRAPRRRAGETWTAPVIAERRQEGCMRFCFVPPGSLTPRRFRCVPDDAHPDALPHFTSLRYGDPGYGQLRRVDRPRRSARAPTTGARWA